MNAQFLQLTAHSTIRMSQRGIGSDDLELALLIGTEVEGGYVVRKKDFQLLERKLKHLRDQARRLVGKRLVVNGSVLVTAYHANQRKQKKLLRGIKEHSTQE